MSENMEQVIVELINKKVSPFLIYLFGSTATGKVHKESDIDIAFLGDDIKLDKYEIFMLAQEIASKLNQDVDLIDLNAASTVFQAQVIHTGKVIYCTNTSKKAEYELKTLKMYAKLNEERTVVLKNIEESGSVYEK